MMGMEEDPTKTAFMENLMASASAIWTPGVMNVIQEILRSAPTMGEGMAQVGERFGISDFTEEFTDPSASRGQLDDVVRQAGPRPQTRDLQALADSQRDLIGEVREEVKKMSADRTEERAKSMDLIQEKLRKMTQQNDMMENTADGLVATLNGVVDGISNILTMLGAGPSGPGRSGV